MRIKVYGRRGVGLARAPPHRLMTFCTGGAHSAKLFYSTICPRAPSPRAGFRALFSRAVIHISIRSHPYSGRVRAINGPRQNYAFPPLAYRQLFTGCFFLPVDPIIRESRDVSPRESLLHVVRIDFLPPSRIRRAPLLPPLSFSLIARETRDNL